MKYFGKRSLSSFLTFVMPVILVLIIAFAIIAAVSFGSLVMYDPDSGQSLQAPGSWLFRGLADDQDFQSFLRMHWLIKALALPYLAAITFFLIQVIIKSQMLFKNFSRDTIFTSYNVALLKKISWSLIVFSILAFRPSGILVAILLLMVTRMMENGTHLQEEHDLTI
jgi:hypothetical protein